MLRQSPPSQRESSTAPSTQEFEGLPILGEGIKFYDWTFIIAGTHGEIYRARDMESGEYCCVKIFRKGWITPFNLEKTAYEFLKHANINEFIPDVYGYDSRTMSEWGFPGSIGDEDTYYAIVMEWLENGQQLSAENITLDYAWNLLEGLYKIHQAGVLHYDLYRRNMIVIPGTKRALWIDFSCAHMNEEYAMPQEMASAAGIILELVFPIFIITECE